MRALLKARLIEPLLQPSIANRDWLVEKTELELLVAELKCKSTRGLQSSGHGVKRYTLAGVDFVSLLQKMLSEEVEYLFTVDIFSPLSLRQFCPEYKTDESEHLSLLTPKDACIALGVN
jgi:hypothetical protein